MLVGSYGGVETAHLETLGIFTTHESYHAGGVLEDVVVFVGVDDAHLVYFLHLSCHDAHIFFGQTVDALLVVVQESLHLLFLDKRVETVVRLEVLEQGILFVLDGLVCFVDREVELGNDRSIHPWLSYIVAIHSALVAWQEPHDDGYGDTYEYGLGGEISPVILFCVVEYAHFIPLFLDYSAKIRKKTAKIAKKSVILQKILKIAIFRHD